MWPERTEGLALGTLRRALSDLRAALPPELILAQHDQLRWNLATPHWLDLEQFEQQIHAGPPSALHAATELYTADLLSDWDEDWILVERERLRQLQFQALSWLSAHHRAISEFDVAIRFARQALALDPLAEAAQRDLMALLYLAGDRAAALAQYEYLCATLRRELNIEPMAKTLALYAAITRGESLAAVHLVQSDRLAPPPTPRTPLDIIGREAEMLELNALWAQASAGHGQGAIVSGEAGIGKSHLVAAFARGVARHGGLTLIGRCYEFENALPYHPLIESLRAAAHVLQYVELAPPHRVMLARLVPEAPGAIEQPAPDEAPASDDPRTQLFEAVLQAFLALARNQALLLLIEDVHCAPSRRADRTRRRRARCAINARHDYGAPARRILHHARRAAADVGGLADSLWHAPRLDQ